jgi:hypothetical protein
VACPDYRIAGNTRKEIEAKTGKKVISPLNAKALQQIGTKEDNINNTI